MGKPWDEVIKNYEAILCPNCNGTGTVGVGYRRGGWAGENITVQETCPKCKGEKTYIFINPCDSCQTWDLPEACRYCARK